MEKTLVAVYKNINGNITLAIESAFRKAVFFRLANYLDNGVYGIFFDLPSSPCYRSFCDTKIENEVQRCYGALPKRYKDSFFVAIRPRRYNVKQGRADAFSCENGVKGALYELLNGKKEYSLLLGEMPSSFSHLYFTDSEGLLEAGGLNALIKISQTTLKNVFPAVNISKSSLSQSIIRKKTTSEIKSTPFSAIKTAKRKSQISYSAFEGLYLTENHLKNTQKDKNNALYLKKIFVFDTPTTEKASVFRHFIIKKDYPRFAYRTAIAASRIFTKTVEKGCTNVNSAVDCALILTALVPMNMFLLLGTAEALESCELLFNTLEEAICVGEIKKDCGKLLFLLVVLEKLYSLRTDSDSRFWSLKLRTENLISIVQAYIKTNIAIHNDIFLSLCYKDTRVNIASPQAVPPLLAAFFSKNDTAPYSFSTDNLSRLEPALCTLICAANICFDGIFYHALNSSPVFLARSTLLGRAEQFNGTKSEKFPKTLTASFEPQSKSAFLSCSAFSPVKLRFSAVGADITLLPYAAYLEKLYRHFSTHNNSIADIYCFISSMYTDLLYNLIRTKNLFPTLSICIILESSRYSSPAHMGKKDGLNIISITDTEKCQNAIKNAVFVKRLYPHTTLFDLETDFRKDTCETI